MSSSLFKKHVYHHVNRYKVSVFILLFIIPFLSHAIHIEHTRGLRYCEVIVRKNVFTMVVYNTLKLNDCPVELWNKMTPQQIENETGYSYVYLNGPRHFLMDAIDHKKIPGSEERVFGGIAMREGAVLHLGLMDLMKGSAPYRQHVVERETTWTYNMGHPIYELIDPKGQVFVMQSYSMQKKPQTLDDLAALESTLQLPKGWRFRTGILQKNIAVTSVHNHAIVIQDDFLNTYQLASDDFLQP